MDKRRTKQYPTGVRPKNGHLEITFIWPKGSKKRCSKTLEYSNTPANIIEAGKLRQRIAEEIRHDIFKWSTHFPDDERAQSMQTRTFAEYAQIYLNSPENDWKPQTRRKFKGILNNIWMPGLFDSPIDKIQYTDLSEAIRVAFTTFNTKFQREPSKSLYNDWLTTVRGVFAVAAKDNVVSRTDNAASHFENKTRDKTEPDPFDLDEINKITDDIYKNDGEMWGAWFELGFFSGMRYPSEPSALIWSNIDLNKGEMKVKQIRTRHGIQNTTKTGVARTVLLNSRSLSALKKARKITGFVDNFVFLQKIKREESGKLTTDPVITGDPQRIILKAALKRLGIRCRDQYNMRHSYATFGLMQGANPAFMASQLGHSMEEFFKTYAKWINNINNQMQMDFIESGLRNKNVDKTRLDESKNN